MLALNKKIIGSVVGIFSISVILFFVLNVSNKNSISGFSKPVTDSSWELYVSSTMSGTYTSCIQNYLGSKKSCRAGFKDAKGKFHALDFVLLTDATKITLSEGEWFEANGKYLSVEKLNDTSIKKEIGEGIFSVTDFVKN